MTLSPDELKALNAARIEKYEKAFVDLSSEQVASCWSKDLIFTDITLNKYEMTHDKCKAFQTKSFGGMKSMQIHESHVSGSLDFSAWEMLIELEFASGNIEWLRGTSLITWRWEGEGDASSDARSIDGWRIVRQHDYFIALQPENKGRTLKLYD